MKLRKVSFGLALVSLLAFGLLMPASALGREWSYERVDTAGNWSNVEVEVMPTGTVCVCYQDTVSHTIMLASKDTAWRHEAIGNWGGTVGRNLVVGPGGRPAVLTGVGPITYKVDTDTGWVTTSPGWYGAAGSVFLAFGTLGVPAVLWVFSASGYVYLSSAKESAGVWVQDTIYSWWQWPEQPYWAGTQGFAVDRENHFYVTFMSELSWSGGHYKDLILSTGGTRFWMDSLIAGGRDTFASGLSLAPRPLSGVAVCYNLVYAFGGGDSFYCDGTVMDTEASIGLVRVDAQNHRQIVYRTDRLRYAYETNVWNFDTLPSVIDVSSLDFAVDSEGRPLIAFVSDSGILLARGGPGAGCAEQKPTPVAGHLTLPTAVRGVLELPRGRPGQSTAGQSLVFLLDVSGRKVAELHPGPNDVSRFGAGVYFVRGLGSGTGGQGEVSKVVIAR